MKDMQELMNDAFTTIKESGFIEETVKKQIEGTISEIIRDTFREYSDFGKQIKEAIKNEIKIDLNQLSLGSYSTVITGMVKEILKEQMDADSRKEAERFLVSLESNDIPAELTISDMVKKITEIFSEHYYLYDGIEEHEGFEFSFHFERKWPNSDSLKNLYRINIDPEEGKNPKDCIIEIIYDSEDQEIDEITVNNKEVMEGRFYSSREWTLEGYLFQLYANKSKLINDANKVETYFYGEYDD